MKKNKIEMDTTIGMNSFFFTKIKGINIHTSICKKFKKDNLMYPIPLTTIGFVELACLIKPVVEAGICVGLGFDINWNKKEYSFYIDVYGMAEVSVSAEIGAYIPEAKAPIQLSLSIGLKGVLGSGKAGIKLSLFIGQNRFDTKVYLELEAFRCSFYILLKFSIDIKFYRFSFEFYIFNQAIAGIKFETHSIAVRYYNSTRIKTLESGTLFYPFNDKEKIF